MKNIIAILPMRSGSQRVINKNSRIINGKYLYEYIVDKLLLSKIISNIIINTDIETVHDKYYSNNKIQLIKRRKNLRGNCDINLVISECINIIEADLFVQVHATNPLFDLSTLEKSINYYFNNNHQIDSLFSVTKIYKRFWYAEGIPVNHDLKDEPTTQNLTPYYEENSCFYLFTKQSFLKKNNRIGNKPKLFEISKDESWDIDDEADLLILEKLLNT